MTVELNVETPLGIMMNLLRPSGKLGIAECIEIRLRQFDGGVQSNLRFLGTESGDIGGRWSSATFILDAHAAPDV